MAEIKWNNVSGADMNTAADQVQKANLIQIALADKLANAGTDFIDVLANRKKEAEQLAKERNTQFAINKMNQANNLGEYEALAQQGLGTMDYANIFGSNIDLTKYNEAQANWQANTLARQQSNESLKDLTPENADVVNRVMQALQTNDLNEFQKAIELLQNSNVSIATKNALTKDITTAIGAYKTNMDKIAGEVAEYQFKFNELQNTIRPLENQLETSLKAMGLSTDLSSEALQALIADKALEPRDQAIALNLIKTRNDMATYQKQIAMGQATLSANGSRLTGYETINGDTSQNPDSGTGVPRDESQKVQKGLGDSGMGKEGNMNEQTLADATTAEQQLEIIEGKNRQPFSNLINESQYNSIVQVLKMSPSDYINSKNRKTVDEATNAYRILMSNNSKLLNKYLTLHSLHEAANKGDLNAKKLKEYFNDITNLDNPSMSSTHLREFHELDSKQGDSKINLVGSKGEPITIKRPPTNASTKEIIETNKTEYDKLLNYVSHLDKMGEYDGNWWKDLDGHINDAKNANVPVHLVANFIDNFTKKFGTELTEENVGQLTDGIELLTKHYGSDDPKKVSSRFFETRDAVKNGEYEQVSGRNITHHAMKTLYKINGNSADDAYSWTKFGRPSALFNKAALEFADKMSKAIENYSINETPVTGDPVAYQTYIKLKNKQLHDTFKLLYDDKGKLDMKLLESAYHVFQEQDSPYLDVFKTLVLEALRGQNAK